MKEEIKNFVEAYLDKIENDNFNESLSKGETALRLIRSISFHIHKHIHTVNGFVRDKWDNHVLELDEEDMQYLYKKYYSKLEEEMNNNLQEIKERYSEVNKK